MYIMHKKSNKSCAPSLKPRSFSKGRLGDPPADLVEFDPLSCDEALLECATDLHRVDRSRQLHWHFGVIQTTGGELVRLGDERLPEPSVVVGRNLSSDTSVLVDVDQVNLRLGVHRHLALGARDLGAVFLPCRHHTAAEQLCDLSSIELDYPDSIVAVIVFAKFRLHSSNADG